jgi:hypothetical protein
MNSFIFYSNNPMTSLLKMAMDREAKVIELSTQFMIPKDEMICLIKNLTIVGYSFDYAYDYIKAALLSGKEINNGVIK